MRVYKKIIKGKNTIFNELLNIDIGLNSFYEMVKNIHK